MSEEIKEKIKAYYIANDIDKILSYITSLQQKVEQLEKENEQLRTQVNTYENPDDLTLFYMWLDEKAKDKIKQLENIRKEAIKIIEEDILGKKIENVNWDYDECYYSDMPVERIKPLLNILNKGDNNGK